MMQRLLLSLALSAAILAVFLCSVFAHDPETAVSPEQKKVFEFYMGWMRPAGNFGIQHRAFSCCNMTDCDVVEEAHRLPDGRLEIVVRGGTYIVNPSIEEANQEDPRESPDGRSHACIIGGVVACYVAGGGV